MTMVIVILCFWMAWLTMATLRHRMLFITARKRIALGLPPFAKAPDDGRDRRADRLGDWLGGQ